MSEVIFSVFPSENFVDLGLYQFGWEQCDPSHSFGPAARNHYLFHYCLSGTGMLYSQNGRKESDTFHIKSGQGFMIFPHQVCMYIADHEIPWEYVWIEFDGLRVKEAIELVGLEEFKKFYPKELSGGLLRRLNIACGIAHKPKLIFLDEPTVAVDPQSRNNILDGIKKLRDNGATIVYTTHYMEEVEILCDRIIILDKGKILASGTASDLKELSEIDEKITVEISEIDESILNEINNLENVDDFTFEMNVLTVKYKKGKNNLGELINFLKKNNVTYNKIFSERPTLNDVFLSLTGKELRD